MGSRLIYSSSLKTASTSSSCNMAREEYTSHPTNIPIDDSSRPAPIATASQPQDDTCATSLGKPKRKTIKCRSDVWDHFTKFVNSEGQIKGECNYCYREFHCDPKKNGTTALRNHMRCCKKHPHAMKTHQMQLHLQSTSTGGENMGALVNWKFDQVLARKALAHMVMVDELPFKFVEREGFRHFMTVVCPKFQIPSRWTISDDCFELFNEERLKLMNELKNSCQRVCLTTDIWTSIQRINYMCLTAHYIDNNWTLKKKILNFCPIFSYKGDIISLAIEKCLMGWKLDRVFTLTVDNASSNDVAAINFKNKMAKWDASIMNGHYLHMRCVAHIINLVVQHGLEDLDESITRVRDAVRYIRQSPARMKKFKECVELEKIECKVLLSLDIPTRWNSTYLMLETAQKFERAFERFDKEDPSFRIHIGTTNWNRDLKQVFTVDGRPRRKDWTKIKKFVTLLQQFFELTLRVSGSSYVTSNTFFHEISTVYCLLHEWQESDDFELSEMAKRMKEKFDKYWGDPKKINQLIYIAVVLDPRHKLEFMEYALQEMYSGEKGVGAILSLKNALYDLYDEYKQKLAPQGKAREPFEVSTPILVEHVEKEKSIRTNLLISRFKKHKSASGSGSTHALSELDKYFSEVCEEDNDDFDILKWWKANCHRFPILSSMARDVLAIPVSTIGSESGFNTGSRVLDPFRSSLSPKVVESLICMQNWLRTSTTPMSVEEDLDHVEKLEEELAKDILDSLAPMES